jgi:hypothetical protein
MKRTVRKILGTHLGQEHPQCRKKKKIKKDNTFFDSLSHTPEDNITNDALSED